MKKIIGIGLLTAGLSVAQTSSAGCNDNDMGVVSKFVADSCTKIIETPKQRVTVRVPFRKAEIAGKDTGEMIAVDVTDLNNTLRSQNQLLNASINEMGGSVASEREIQVTIDGKIVGSADPVGNIDSKTFRAPDGSLFKGHVHGVKDPENQKTAELRGDQALKAVKKLLKENFNAEVNSAGILIGGKVHPFTHEESGEINTLGAILCRELGIDAGKIEDNEIEARVFTMINGKSNFTISNPEGKKIIAKISKRMDEMHIVDLDLDISLKQKVNVQSTNIGNFAFLLAVVAIIASLGGTQVFRLNRW